MLWFAETLIPHSFYSSPTPNWSGCVQRDRNNQTEFPFRISGIRPIIQIRASGGWWGPLPEQQLSELQMYLLLLHNIYRWLDYVERHHIICPDISHNSIRSSLPCLLVWCRTLNEWTPDVTYKPKIGRHAYLSLALTRTSDPHTLVVCVILFCRVDLIIDIIDGGIVHIFTSHVIHSFIHSLHHHRTWIHLGNHV